jgi:membrane-bound serine protease (ClpP class)
MKKRVLLLLLVTAVTLAASASRAADAIYWTHLTGSINPISKEFVLRAIDRAEKDRATTLVIELNTPGGLGESMRDIVMGELGSTVPIVVFVGPAGARAASAGVFITLAAHVAAMAPGTNIGAAHPVDLFGTEEKGSTMAEKATNDAVAFARSIAEERGRDASWAEEAVRESGSLSATEALARGVIDMVVAGTEELLARLDGYALRDGRVLHTAGLSVWEIRPTLRERLLGYLVDPNLVYVLFILGLGGLAFELFHPGIGFGLVVGVVCLILALFGLQILPVNVAGVVLILFGIALFILDVFTPTHGALTAGGIAGLLLGSLTLFNIPDRAVGLSLSTVLLTAGAITSLFVFVLSKGLLIQRKRPVTGPPSLVGQVGSARTDLAPEGKVFIQGEYWDARSLEGPIPAGRAVVVERLDGRRLLVRSTS